MRKYLRKQIPKFYYPNKLFGNKRFTLLDIGAGNHSASKTKGVFPNCEYHGVDLDKTYHNDERDFEAMAAFYEMDLTLLNFNSIPDAYFDFIRMTHVIEHLHNGDEVVSGLLPKLKPGGYIYVEFPGVKSTRLPSMEGTLNFYDDKTHVRVYSSKELGQQMSKEGCRILSSGTRRNMAFILAMPFLTASALLRGKKLQGPYFWDILGFAEYVFAQKQ